MDFAGADLLFVTGVTTLEEVRELRRSGVLVVSEGSAEEGQALFEGSTSDRLVKCGTAAGFSPVRDSSSFLPAPMSGLFWSER